MGNIQTFIDAMIYWCRDVSLGYSQNRRWDIRPGGDCDCSSLVIYALRQAGFDTGNATYTGNLSRELTKHGWQRLAVNDNPAPGDILLNDQEHVAVYLGNQLLAQASQSENKTTDGTPGDQTGEETNISPYYNFPWNCYLHYNENNQTESNDMPVKTDPINWDGNNVSVEYAMQDLKHRVDYQNQQLENLINTIGARVWGFEGDNNIKDMPLYSLRNIENIVKQQSTKQ